MSKQDFINKIAPYIQSECKKRGYDFPSAVIAQACLESNYGESALSKKYHNYFGMKCGSSWKGRSVNLSTKEEYKQGTLTDIKANFRVYSNMEDGVKGYFDFISRSRYNRLKLSASPLEYFQYLHECGYATSSSYVRSLSALHSSMNLSIYDAPVTVATAVTTPVTSPVVNGSENDSCEHTFRVGQVYTLTANVNARKSPNGVQYNVNELSANGRKACTNSAGKATYKKGTRVTCKDVQVLNGSIWVKTPSCWLCGFSLKANAFYME